MFFGYPIQWLFFKRKTYYENEKNPKTFKGGKLLISNHYNFFDYAVTAFMVFPRKLNAVTSEGPFKYKLLRFGMKFFGAIECNRKTKNMGFMDKAADVIKKGQLVQIYPEGRNTPDGKIHPFKKSYLIIAHRAKAPIVPVVTDGNYGIFKRANVCIGEPFSLTSHAKEDLNEGEQLTHLTNVLEEKVYALKTLITQNENNHKLFSFKHLAMDMARLVCAPLIPILRIKRRTPQGEKYRAKLKGGAIIAANHTSFIDPFVVGVTFWYRRLHFLVAEIVMGGKLRSTLLKGVGAIKIDRNAADIEAITKSVNKLKQGFLLAIFPQGQINKDDNINQVKSGAVLMAIRSNTPIIPMYIAPRKKWYHSRTVIIGDPIYPRKICTKAFPSAADLEKITLILSEELNHCKLSSENP
jgi:1-acyl-sn-glycerol-3-phosphate acyltransferase